jgi:actin-related protein
MAQCLVVDFGTKNCRYGWSGDARPESILSRSLAPEGSAQHFIDRGLVSDWSSIDHVWSDVFARANASPEETPILFADSPVIRDQDREKMAEILFEKFSIPHYFVGNQGVLSIYSCGRTSALLVDAGYGATHAMAIHEGYAYPQTIERMEVGGADIATLLDNLLRDRGVDTSVLDMDSVQEQLSQVSTDFVQDSIRLRTHVEEQPALTLPDGTAIALPDEHLRCGEALFQPAMVGVAGDGLGDRLGRIVRTCEADKEGGPMRALPSCVLLAGGLSQMPGMAPRVRLELERRAASSRSFFLAALVQDEARTAAWLGGSVLASLPGFVANNFVSAAEFREFGPSAVHRRC